MLLPAQDAQASAPLLKTGEPVDWWIASKFDVGSFPEQAAHAVKQLLIRDDKEGSAVPQL